MSKSCKNCIWYEYKVSDEYYIPEKDDYTWWWYDYCKKRQETIEDTEEEICRDYQEKREGDYCPKDKEHVYCIDKDFHTMKAKINEEINRELADLSFEKMLQKDGLIPFPPFKEQIKSLTDFWSNVFEEITTAELKKKIHRR